MKLRNWWMWMLGLWIPMSGTLAVTPDHTGRSSGAPISRPRAPQSVEPQASSLPALSIVEFLSVIGAAPAASSDSVTPKSDEEKPQWETRLTEWRAEQAKLLVRVRALVPGKADRLTQDTKGALVALKGEIEGWQNRAKAAAWGNQVFTPEALGVAQDTAEFLVAYSEAFAELGADLGQSRVQKERRAFEAALRQQPEAKLLQPSSKALEAMTPHHREQLGQLLALRDALRKTGDLEQFAASLRRDTRPSRQIENVAQR
jgi:hypothetical protein